MELETLESAEVEAATVVERGCRVCGSGGPHAVHEAREMMFGLRDRFDYFECADCGCLQIAEFPGDIAAYYPKEYYAHAASPEENFARPWRAALLRAKGRWAVFGTGLPGRAVFRRAPEADMLSLRRARPSLSTSILDVGCGNGRLLYLLRETGFRNLLGVDPFIGFDRTYGNGLRVEKKFLAEVRGQWDVVMLHHAFEHMDRPAETLREVRRLLAPGGQCILRVPVADSWAWRHYGVNWVQLDAPRHSFLHTRASMARLAAEAGLRVVAAEDDSTEFQFMGSELYRKGIPHTDYAGRYGELFTRAERRGFRARAEALNAAGEGDSTAFYLGR